jgi:asparagine synthase (glutamine-hydrolysing)
MEAALVMASVYAVSDTFQQIVNCTLNGEAVDDAAVNVFRHLGCFLGTTTAFREVTVPEPPAEAYQVTPIALNRDQALDAYIDLFRHAVTRCLAQMKDAPGISLSGGRDSRHILFELHRAGVAKDVHAWTIDLPNANDIEVARVLASRVHLKSFTELQVRNDVVCCEREKNQLIGYTSILHGWFVSGRPMATRMSAVWDGIGGDMLSAGLCLDPEQVKLAEHGSVDALARQIVGKSREAGYEEAVHAVGVELRKWLAMPNPLTAFWFWNRTYRNISGSLAVYGTKAITPYLDGDLYRFLMGLPAHMTIDGSFHTDAISRAFREFADLPYAAKQRYRPEAIRYYRRCAVEGLKLARLGGWKSAALMAAALSKPRKYGPAAVNRLWEIILLDDIRHVASHRMRLRNSCPSHRPDKVRS